MPNIFKAWNGTAFVEMDARNSDTLDGKHASELVIKSGDTMTGKLTFPASITSTASLNIPHGVAPTTPVNGDMWTTTAAPMIQLNGTTRTIYHSGNAGTAALTTATQVEAEAGTSTTVRAWTPQRVSQAIAALATQTLPKVQSLTNRVTVGTATGTIAIGVTGFDNTKDALTVYQNSVYIREAADTAGEFTVSGTNIVKNSGTWPVGTIIDFQVIRVSS